MRRRLAKGVGLGLLLLMAIAFPRFSGSDYYVHLANMIGISVILTMSLNLLFGYTGQVSVGHAAFYAIGAYTTALLMAKLKWPFWVGVPTSFVTAGLAGALLGLPCLRLRGYYLAMATLGFAVVIYVVLQQWQPLTGGAMGIIGIPRPQVGEFTFSNESSFYYLVLAATIVSFLVVRNIVASPAGRAMVAIRESETAAEALGVHLTRYKLLSFMVSAALAGLAGSLFAPLSRFVSPDGFTLLPSIIILAMLVIGGLGSHLGAVLGGILMVLLPELIGFVGEFRVFVYSIALILTVVFMPEGVAGMVHHILEVVRGKLKMSSVTAAQGRTIKSVGGAAKG